MRLLSLFPHYVYLPTCNQLQDEKIVLLEVRVMKPSGLVLFHFALKCLEFASANLF